MKWDEAGPSRVIIPADTSCPAWHMAHRVGLSLHRMHGTLAIASESLCAVARLFDWLHGTSNEVSDDVGMPRCCWVLAKDGKDSEAI